MRAMLLHVLGLNNHHTVGVIPNCAHSTLLLHVDEEGQQYWATESNMKVKVLPMPDGNAF